MPGKRRFKVDARVLLSLGRESIKDHTTALLELVKNSYDADAQRVDIEFAGDGLKAELRISDNGLGMTSADIENKWLRIGFSEKRVNKISKKGRRETGEKGIGRLSADRLGARLELRSRQAAARPVGIRVDWDQFDQDGADIGAVAVDDIPASQMQLPPAFPIGSAVTGTEIKIKDLRQPWNTLDLDRLEDELSTLISSGVSKDAFQIWLKRPNGQIERLASTMDGSAELSIDAEFDGKGTMTYVITGRPSPGRTKRRVISRNSTPWSEGIGNTALRAYDLGPISVSLSFYLRSATNLADGVSLTQLRTFLGRNAGIRIYRDEVRVKPYGDLNHPEGDWLGMAARKTTDPAGAARRNFKFSANQVVGSVQIGRDRNKTLLDSASREGLVQGNSYATLRSAVYRCITTLETAYHTAFTEAKSSSEELAESIPAVVTSMKTTLDDLQKEVTRKGNPSDVLAETAVRLRSVTEAFKKAEQAFEVFANESVIYRGLATVGISSAVFGHETESALSLAKMASKVLDGALKRDDPNLAICRRETAKLISTIGRIDLWGQFALTRVKRDKRRRSDVNVSKLVEGLTAELRPLFTSLKIAFTSTVTPDLYVKGFAMDIESAVLNLLTNAYHHASLKSRNRIVEVSLGPSMTKGRRFVRLSVEDSGTGISKENMDRVWAPLYSTKGDANGNLIGTGLGLSIVRSVVREMNGETEVIGHGSLGGARFSLFLPRKE